MGSLWFRAIFLSTVNKRELQDSRRFFDFILCCSLASHVILRSVSFFRFWASALKNETRLKNSPAPWTTTRKWTEMQKMHANLCCASVFPKMENVALLSPEQMRPLSKKTLINLMKTRTYKQSWHFHNRVVFYSIFLKLVGRTLRLMLLFFGRFPRLIVKDERTQRTERIWIGCTTEIIPKQIIDQCDVGRRRRAFHTLYFVVTEHATFG